MIEPGKVLEPINPEQTYKWVIVKVYESALPECVRVEAQTRMADGSIAMISAWNGSKHPRISLIDVRELPDGNVFVEDNPEGYEIFRLVSMNDSMSAGAQLELEIR